MPIFEYKVVPAPAKGIKAKGIKTPEARFSNTLQTLINDLAAEGWEYQRAETLPSIERSGLTGSVTEWRNVLVFRRVRTTATDALAPELLPPPEVDSGQNPETDSPAAPLAEAPESPETGDENTLAQGMEETPEDRHPSASLNQLAEARKSTNISG